MRQDDTTHPARTGGGLHECTACREPFVIPVDVLDVYDGGRCLVELFCTNCHDSRVGVHDDSELMALDEQLQASTAAMHSAVDVLEAIDEWERVERFVRALHDDLVLPEDF
jgi:hypothetical protein